MIFDPALTDDADGTFVIEESACAAVATVVVVVALLFVVTESVVELTVTESLIVVPDAVPPFTCTTGENVVLPGARLAIVQVKVPVPPTGMVLHAQPAGGVNDRKFVLAGITSVNVTVDALLGPGFDSTCV